MDNWWEQQDQDDTWIQKQLEEEEQFLDEQMDLFNNAMSEITVRTNDGYE